MSLQTSMYHADSDADDEYERSVITSPHLQTDSEASPTDSDIASSEHTPTKFGSEGPRTPRTVISEWTADECVDFLTSLGLLQYCGTFRENGIVGEALIALKHDELKEMGINSVGHRLTILKSVYEIKIRQHVPLDVDHYIPLSADQSMNENATQDDIARLIQSIQRRDEKIMMVEAEMHRLAEDYRRLREEILPVIKIAKDRSQPLPPPSSLGTSSDSYHDTATLTSPSQLTLVDNSTTSKLHRAFSKRTYTGGTTPKNNSPTHIPPSIYESRNYHDNQNLDPSAAAVAASSHLSASVNGGLQHSPAVPSPTSPNAHTSQHQTLNPRSYTQPSSGRSMHDHSDDIPQRTASRADRLTPREQPSRTETPSGSRESSAPPGQPSSVEIFKSFRVSWDDPCYKVLPAALKKYNIHSDPKLYALYIVYGDQERCLALDEKPLILFKQLEKEGRKPMFMLRKIHPDNPTYPIPGSAPNSAGFESGRPQAQINLPGGVL
ncbi:uncharacterized protein N7473_004710 [Penicillium subrubescens]|uniref:Protein STE50 n=1 Tax=Penicillium subrubescens TaxID=1316194 RepID=A0A1Q5UHK4_9EURO|nr:uncharacterized protein N7473_004710 [Penicillium subrubescens]KAJ5900640.1 hypothetical protein N7473_004710 [Penicillium subrubescens]OKP11967.1 Protein STE50 [Penicillium subrubescens]